MPHNHINELFSALSALPDHGTMRQILETAKDICTQGECQKLRLLDDPSLTVEPIIKGFHGVRATLKF